MASEAYDATRASVDIAASYFLRPLEALDVFLPNIMSSSSSSPSSSWWPSFPSFRAPRFNPVTDIPSLTGKVILVTGGNNGIGRETILQLARHGPKHIFLGARTESKASAAIASIQSEVADVSISWLPLDLTSFPSIKKAVEQVDQHESGDRLDVLVLNAGIMATPLEKTETGQEIQLGTNYVGHFLLTKLLLPKLLRTAESSASTSTTAPAEAADQKEHVKGSDVRIISVASEANRMAPPIDTITSTEKLTNVNTWVRYGASKASNIMLAAELARRYPQITSVSVHPGVIKTNLYDPSTAASPFLKIGLQLASFAFVNVPDGALTQLYLAAGAAKSDLKNGQYYTPYGKLRYNKWAESEEDAKTLWEWTEKELANAGY